MRVCSVEGCGGKHCAKGLCNKHWSEQYRKTDKGKESRKKYQNSDKRKATEKRWRSTERGIVLRRASHERYKGSDSHKASKKRWRQTEKGKAMNSLLRKVQRKYKGVELNCNINGCENTDIEKHHEDYSNIYDIIPLCGVHHRELHGMG